MRYVRAGEASSHRFRPVLWLPVGRGRRFGLAIGGNLWFVGFWTLAN